MKLADDLIHIIKIMRIQKSVIILGERRLGEQFGEFWVGEPNFDLANTNEFFANPNKIWRTEMRLGELHFELREQQNFYQWDQMVNFSNFRQKNIFTVVYS